jgi:hypothetical protein
MKSLLCSFLHHIGHFIRLFELGTGRGCSLSPLGSESARAFVRCIVRGRAEEEQNRLTCYCTRGFPPLKSLWFWNELGLSGIFLLDSGNICMQFGAMAVSNFQVIFYFIAHFSRCKFSSILFLWLLLRLSVRISWLRPIFLHISCWFAEFSWWSSCTTLCVSDWLFLVYHRNCPSFLHYCIPLIIRFIDD